MAAETRVPRSRNGTPWTATAVNTVHQAAIAGGARNRPGGSAPSGARGTARPAPARPQSQNRPLQRGLGRGGAQGGGAGGSAVAEARAVGVEGRFHPARAAQQVPEEPAQVGEI